MSEMYQKTMLCQQVLHDELLRVIEGAHPSEIDRCLALLNEQFSLKNLRDNLSRYYILYDGFFDHIAKIIEPFRHNLLKPAVMNPADVPLATDKLSSTAESAKNPEQNPQENILENSTESNPDINQEKSNPQKTDGPLITGAQLSGRGYEELRSKLVDRLQSYSNIETINFKMDYQVEIYANQINDDLLKNIESIQKEVAPNIPEFRLSVNVRKDRRKDSER